MPVPRYTLLTGATGQLGRHLLADLLRSGLPTAVLVRDGADRSAAARIDSLLGELEAVAGRWLPRPVVLAGELTSPGLGLSEDARDWAGRNVVRVLHSAASLSFKPAASHPHNEPFRTNVEALETLLDLMRQWHARELHYVSTAYVCGLAVGRVPESPLPRPEAFANDYEQSKWQAEGRLAEVLAAGDLASLTVTRPSIVIDSSDRAARTDRTIYSTLATLRLLMNRFGAGRPDDWTALLGLSGQERKNIIEATWAARTTVEILRHRRLHDATYHLTAPQGTSIGEMTATFHEVLVAAGEFREGSSGPVSNPALDAMAAGFVQTFAPYFRDDPAFAREQAAEAIATTTAGEPPRIDRTVLADLASRLIAADSAPPAEPPAATAAWARAKLHTHEPEVGLIVHGPGGGDWTLAPAVALGGGSNAPVRLHIRADTWREVLQGGSLDAALTHLAASLETDGPPPEEARRRVEELVEALVARWRASRQPAAAPPTQPAVPTA